MLIVKSNYIIVRSSFNLGLGEIKICKLYLLAASYNYNDGSAFQFYNEGSEEN